MFDPVSILAQVPLVGAVIYLVITMTKGAEQDRDKARTYEAQRMKVYEDALYRIGQECHKHQEGLAKNYETLLQECIMELQKSGELRQETMKQFTLTVSQMEKLVEDMRKLVEERRV